MTACHVLAAACSAAALAFCTAAPAADRAALEGPGVVFTVFENLPPSGACPGLYAVDARTREISWLGGYDASARDFAIYPGFTAAGRLSYGYFDRASPLPSLNIHVGDRVVAARAAVYTRPSWSPRREEVAFGRLDGRGRLELAMASAAGTRRIGPPSALWPTWTPGGTGLVYTRGVRGRPAVLTFVSRDGRTARTLARNVREYPAPQVSPNGKRVVFVRPSSVEDREEVWMVATRGGGARRVLGPAGRGTLAPVAWLSNRALLVQSGGRDDSIFDLGDRLVRLDVETGRTTPFPRRGFGLALSPDRSRLLFVRAHLRAGEQYYSIRTVRVDGRDEQLLAVTDYEDLNIGSVPVWKPATASVEAVGDQPPAALDPQECARRVTSLRDQTR